MRLGADIDEVGSTWRKWWDQNWTRPRKKNKNIKKKQKKKKNVIFHFFFPLFFRSDLAYNTNKQTHTVEEGLSFVLCCVVCLLLCNGVENQQISYKQGTTVALGVLCFCFALCLPVPDLSLWPIRVLWMHNSQHLSWSFIPSTLEKNL